MVVTIGMVVGPCLYNPHPRCIFYCNKQTRIIYAFDITQVPAIYCYVYLIFHSNGFYRSRSFPHG